MSLMKNIVLATFISTAALATAPSVMAAGKVKNATAAQVAELIDNTIAAAEESLVAIQAGEDKETILALLKKTKSYGKAIESNVVQPTRDRGLEQTTKARSAIKKGNNEAAIEAATKAIEIYKDVKVKYKSF